MSVQVEKIIATAIRAALRTIIDANIACAQTPVDCVRLSPEVAPVDQDSVGSVVVVVRPYVPSSSVTGSVIYPAGRCAVSVVVRIDPAQDSSREKLDALWGAVQDVFYRNGLTFDSGVTYLGTVITGGEDVADDAGIGSRLDADIAVSVAAP